MNLDTFLSFASLFILLALAIFLIWVIKYFKSYRMFRSPLVPIDDTFQDFLKEVSFYKLESKVRLLQATLAVSDVTFVINVKGDSYEILQVLPRETDASESLKEYTG